MRNERSAVAVGFWTAPFGAPSRDVVFPLPNARATREEKIAIAADLARHFLRWADEGVFSRSIAHALCAVTADIDGGIRCDLARNLPDLHAHPQPLDLKADDGDVVSPAAEAPSGHPVGLGGPAAAAEDGEDGHGGSVPPVDADGTWAELRAIAEGISEEAAASMPRDGAMNHDHYIYGTERRYATYHNGEWVEALLGAAFAVGNDGAPWADVFTRDRVRVRVVLREPVERGDYVWRENVAGFVTGEEREG